MGADHAGHPCDSVDRVPEDEPVNERRAGWGMSAESVSEVVYPASAADVVQAFDLARKKGWKVGFWGNGRSYGDAALNDSNLTLDFSKMDRILEWDRESGRVVLEPGVTLQKLWRTILPDGWWPPVVSGTMHTSIGGLLAANAHGKNNWKHGPIGEHVESFEFVTPDGKIHTVGPESEPSLFHAAIGGFGWLGAFTRVVMRMKRVHSGRIGVEAVSADSLDAMFRGFERFLAEDRDYVVGWIDGFAGGPGLGRGQIHAAKYIGPGEDPEGRTSLALTEQDLPGRFFGVIPAGMLWRFAKPWANRLGWRIVCAVKYWTSTWASAQHKFLQPHAQFNFLLDYVPNWKFVYKPGGLIQIQLFLPKDRAQDVFRRALEIAQQARLEPWLVVMKRHRPDKFWMTHAVDGYSFALDFPVSDARREDLWRLSKILSDLVADAGGRFYFAKDSVVQPDAVRRAFGDETLGRFFALKRELDPDDLLQGNLYRRVLAPLRAVVPQIASAPPTPVPETAPEPVRIDNAPPETA
jgi:decaprenylphospho-beta-D-ribofuranose 2-oxidase